MNYTLNNKICSSKFIKEEYFPIIIEFSSEELNNRFIEFYFKDTDMFELSVNPETYELKRFSLTLCNHYSFEDGLLSLPEYVEGTIAIEGPLKTECSTFSVTVYNDGVYIKTSSDSPTVYIKCGNIIFSIANNNELSSVLIVGLTDDEIAHVKTELTA